MCLEVESSQASHQSFNTFLADIFEYLDALESLRSCRAVTSSWRDAAQSAHAAWGSATFAVFPGMAEAVLTQAQEQGAGAGADIDWFKIFVARCAKRREWAAKKDAQKSKKVGHAVRLNAELSGDLERATKFAIGPEGRNNRKRQVREKTCKRCGERFTPAAGGACFFHAGKYEKIGKEGQAAVPEGAQRGGRRGQSKLDLCGDFQWSCCLDAEAKARGCKSAEHY